MKHMLLRNTETRQPVTYCTVPVPDDMARMIKAFCDPERCEVNTIDSDGSRESLAAAFRDNEGWRPAKV